MNLGARTIQDEAYLEIVSTSAKILIPNKATLTGSGDQLTDVYFGGDHHSTLCRERSLGADVSLRKSC